MEDLEKFVIYNIPEPNEELANIHMDELKFIITNHFHILKSYILNRSSCILNILYNLTPFS